VITYRSLPWQANVQVEEYQKLFRLLGSEPGEWRFMHGSRDVDELTGAQRPENRQ
jgi:hypothetical protein